MKNLIMTKLNNVKNDNYVNVSFVELTNELINGADSLLDKYNKLKDDKLKCGKTKALYNLANKLLCNHRKLFALYKNGEGIKEAEEYLKIGNLYINSINSDLNLLSTKFAIFSVGLSLFSIILAIVTILINNIS